jgi:lysine 2,3-aminomutase
MKKTLRSTQQLIQAGLIDADDAPGIERVAENFQVAISPQVQTQIQHEAVRLQYLPSEQELKTSAAELNDPIGDQKFTPVKGITHRYPDRVLLKPLHTCAVYCRFCFRREKVGQAEELLRSDELEQAFQYIEQNPQIWEVILTGGDPLSLSLAKLEAILARLDQIDHVKIIRIHTRIPVADPQKISDDYLPILKRQKPIYIIIHCNSHLELHNDSVELINKLVDNGNPLLSQSVLLKGVNNSAKQLEKLFRRLVELRVRPYYLHHPDLARGTSHFRVPLQEGRDITAQLRQSLSGIAQPLYVLDVPGGHGKVPAGREFIRREEEMTWKIQTIHDTFIDYQDQLQDT